MLDMIKTLDLLDLSKTIAKDLFLGTVYPHEVLPKIHDYILMLQSEVLSEKDYEIRHNNIYIHKRAKVSSTARMDGPCIVDEGALVRPGAFIRGDAIVGKNSVVGNSTELKNVIIFDDTQVPHYNYVGDSILGYKSHMGAGATASNVKGDRTLIKIRNGEEVVETGLRKFGVILGDYVEVGCNSVLNPGTVICRNSNVYPLSNVRGVIPPNCIYKSISGYEIVEKEDRG